MAPLLKERQHVVAGLVSGVAQAGMLSPLDRALYLSMVERRPLLQRANWAAPYQGILQTISHRTLSGSLYYVLQDEMLAIITTATGMTVSRR